MTTAARPKLLCVDDEESILHSLSRLFKPQFEVLTAASGRDALAHLESNRDCAVVLSDYRMREMDGLELLREVRDRYPLASRAIISGQIDLQVVSDAINRADIHKFFLKPWENEYLRLQMSEALQLHRTLTERAHYQRLALTDPVTSVGNHRFFQDQLRRDLELAPGALALLIYDVDHFKRFNDRFGHPRGDQLLRDVAFALAEAAEGRGHVARYGGEEFTMVLPGFDEAAALAVAEATRQAVERRPEQVTVSVGLAVFPTHADTAAGLIERADQALYLAKSEGRNRVATARKDPQ